jgi:hypothetical protein
MRKLFLFLLAAVIGTLAVSAYRDAPDGIFARFKAWAQPYVRDVGKKVTTQLGTASTQLTAMVKGLLDESRCSFTCNYSSAAAGATRTITTGPADALGLRAVGEILAESGLKANFKVLSGDVANASAFVHEGERVIVYSLAWMAKLTESVQSKWAVYAVLAHEIGHHLNGDTMAKAGDYQARSAAQNHEQELAADYFAGFVLAKLGASEQEATAAVHKYGGAESHSHPAKERRIAEHRRGWAKGRQSDSPAALVPDVSAQLVALQQEIGRHAEHYGPGHALIDGVETPCLVQCKLVFAGRVMKVKGIRYDAATREVAILDWRLDPQDGRPHPVTVAATGTLDGHACHRVTIANAGVFNYAVAPGERKERDPHQFARLLQRYVELGAR